MTHGDELASAELTLGRSVRLFVPLSDQHGASGTIVRLMPAPPERAVTAEVQLDGRDDRLLVHVSCLRRPPRAPADALSAGADPSSPWLLRAASAYPLEVCE